MPKNDIQKHYFHKEPAFLSSIWTYFLTQTLNTCKKGLNNWDMETKEQLDRSQQNLKKLERKILCFFGFQLSREKT